MEKNWCQLKYLFLEEMSPVKWPGDAELWENTESEDEDKKETTLRNASKGEALGPRRRDVDQWPELRICPLSCGMPSLAPLGHLPKVLAHGHLLLGKSQAGHLQSCIFKHPPLLPPPCCPLVSACLSLVLLFFS